MPTDPKSSGKRAIFGSSAASRLSSCKLLCCWLFGRGSAKATCSNILEELRRHVYPPSADQGQGRQRPPGHNPGRRTFEAGVGCCLEAKARRGDDPDEL